MKKPAIATTPPSTPTMGLAFPESGTAFPESGTVFTETVIGKTRTGTLVYVRRHGDDEWAVYVGGERCIVGKNHAYALVVAEAWCAGRAIHIETRPI